MRYQASIIVLFLVILIVHMTIIPVSAQRYPQNRIWAFSEKITDSVSDQGRLNRELQRAESVVLHEIPSGTGETQLSYFGARYLEHEYPPRFITADPLLSGSFDLTNPQSFNLYTYCQNDPINMIDPDGKYGRGAGFTDKQWKKFDVTQTKAANKMEKRADKLDRKAAKLVAKSKAGAAADLRKVESYLRQGAAVLNSDGTGPNGTIANAFSAADYQSQLGGNPNGAALAEVGGKVVNLNIDHDIWRSSGIISQFAIGHESLHNVGLVDQSYSGDKAYKRGSAKQQAAFQALKGTPKALINPDYIMDIVY